MKGTGLVVIFIVIYYECLTYTGFLGELEHLKIETRSIDERFSSVMGECVTLK